MSRATNTVEYPTSTILNTLMNDYFLKQESQWVLREAYNYMDKFLFLHLGRDQSERDTWLKLVLSAMRNDVDCRRPEVFNSFDLESKPDLHGCWTFFSDLLHTL